MSQAPADRYKIPQALWTAVERTGLSPAAVLRQARLPVSLWTSEQALVSTEQYFALWRAIDMLKGDSALGIRLVEGTDTAIHPPAMLAAFHASDYRDALHRIARFKRLCTPEKLHVVEGPDGCTVTFEWIYSTEPGPPITTDVTFASLLELGRRGTGYRIEPVRLELARPSDDCSYRQQYFGTIRYGAPRDAMILRREDLDRPFPGHNPELLAILTPALASALEELDARNSITNQVKVVVKRRLASGRPELADVARELGLSERTLQRRITDAGTTFRQLTIEARQEQGRELLRNPSADIDEIAYLLGYQDTSSFYRAFRFWEGVTPARWRENHRGQSHGDAPLH